MKKLLIVLTFAMSIILSVGCSLDPDGTEDIETPTNDQSPQDNGEEDARSGFTYEDKTVFEDEYYFSETKVAMYLHAFDELPPNYLTKQEAEDKGWVPSQGNLWDVTDQGLIGGDNFGNREGLLPSETGRNYFSADVNYDPDENEGRRGAERLVFSNDGLIFYTDDHYDSYEEITFDE